MNTPPSTPNIIQQLRLAADILETGHPWEYRNIDTHGWLTPNLLTPVHVLAQEQGEIRLALATPPDGRTLHNPNNLTVSGVCNSSGRRAESYSISILRASEGNGSRITKERRD